jgi:DUF2971 family protein
MSTLSRNPNRIGDFLSEEPPAVLYHYTDQQGLLGIVRTGKMWATNIEYLNDQREYRHALALMEECLRARQPDHRALKLLKRWLSGKAKPIESYVCSFSCEADSLAQWRAYGGAAGGYAIGFEGETLRQAAGKNDMKLVKCVYESEQQSTIVEAVINDVMASLHEPLLSEYVEILAPRMKHSGFAEEREWRLVGSWEDRRPEDKNFRKGASMLVPYYEVDCQPIACVVVGPTIHETLARRSVQRLLWKYGQNLHHEKVTNSIIPYRAW